MLWILPLTSMHEQYRQRFHKHGLSFETWTFSSHPSNAAKNILVIMEQGAEPKLREFVDQLLTSKRVVRVVLDEAHLALTHDSFRTIMGLLKWLGQAGVQILLMSATVPPSLEQAIFHKLGIADYVVCRERTDRRNISYNVLIAKDIHLALGRVCGEIMKAPPTHQALIFCRSREICEAAAKQLDLPFCHSGMSREEVDTTLQQLRQRKTRAVVCTSLLGVSLDVDDIYHTIHLDYPYDVMSFLQESGRCGRKPNALAYSWVIIPTTHSHIRIKDPDLFGAKLIVLWANNQLRCRRPSLHDFNDGFSEECSMMTMQTHFCDVCRLQSSEPPPSSSLDPFTTLSADLLDPCDVRE